MKTLYYYITKNLQKIEVIQFHIFFAKNLIVTINIKGLLGLLRAEKWAFIKTFILRLGLRIYKQVY